MSACPNCGALPRPNDKFCNTCGTPVAQGAPAGGPPAGGASSAYGAPPPVQPPPGAYGAPPPQWGAPPPPPARCQMGHEIPVGQSYCAQGHPIALDGMQFAGGPQPGFAQQPAASGYGGAYGGAPPQPYPQQPGFPPPQQQQQAQQAPYAPPPQYGGQQGYAPAPPYAPPGGAPLPGYTPPPPGMPAAEAAAAPGARVLRGFLVSFQSNAAGDFWPLHSGRLTVGRSNSGEALDVPLADATISSRHAVITIDAAAGTVQVEDTGSTNGTFVNDEHLGFNGRRELRDGDRIRFGGYTTVVKVIGRI
jgi:hypothetical protein